MIALLLILIGSIVIVGSINLVRSLFAGRRGYRFFQPLRSVIVLFHKESVYSSRSSMISRIAAPIYLGSLVVAGLMVPLGGEFGALLGFSGDIVAFCMLLGLSKLSLIWAALDSGGSFSSMGASRESLYGLLLEPALYLLIATLCVITSCWSFEDIFSSFDNVSLPMMILSVVVGYGLVKLALVEGGRQPVDDSRTHLELTMVHEALTLDMTGVDLAYVHIGGWLKLSIFSTLIVNSIVPAQVSAWTMLLYYFIGVLCFSLIVGFIESFSARGRMNKNTTYILSVSAVGLLAFIVAMLLQSDVLIY